MTLKRTETTTRYTYDDQRVAVQTRVCGGVETDFRHYVFGNYIDEVLLMHVIPAQAPNQDLYYAHDHLYSPVALLDDTGAVVERYEYDAYGSVQILNSQFSILNSSQYGNPYTFTGRELDTLDAGSCKLMYYRARTYDPETGRFMQRDPLGVNPAGRNVNPFDVHKQYGDGLGLYRYAKSSPVHYGDPWGLYIIGPGGESHFGPLPKKVDVQVCCRDVNVCWYVNIAAKLACKKHCWIKTSEKEAGLGAADEDGLPAYPCYGTQCIIKDHDGDSNEKGVTCYSSTNKNCDEDCVNRELVIGKDKGEWSRRNNCNTFVKDIFNKCGCQRRCIRWEYKVFPGGGVMYPVLMCAEWDMPAL